jgi:fatty-acyl-CoA synthase
MAIWKLKIKDYKSGGEWISSVALESALMAHPKIKEAAVIAIADEKIEKPLATIVLVNKEDTVSDEELTEFLSRDFVKYQIPKDYVFINEVPKQVGKFDKRD